MEKEEWIGNVLNSLDGITRAEAPDILAQVEAHIGSRQVTLTISSGTLWRIAASVVLLVALNITILLRYHQAHAPGHSEDAEALFGLGQAAASHTDIGTLFFGPESMSYE